MYGFVNSALEKLIKRRFGVEKWNEIRVRAGVELGEADTFQVNHVYKDEDTYAVVQAASEVLGLDPSTILEMFGEQFLLWCQESGYARTLKLLGRSLQDFLTNLDALHDHLSIIYPQMEAPSFRCTEGFKTSEFLLHYYSDRAGLENIVMGIVKTVSREYYNTEVEMKLVLKKGHEEADHSIFSIRELGYHRESVGDGTNVVERSVDSFSDTQLVTSSTFCKAFPFHIIFGSDMNIRQLGSSLAWVLPNLKNADANLTRTFALERPKMKLTFENVLSHINTIFILRMLPESKAGSDCSPPSGHASFSLAGSDPMRLRGQMIYLPEVECMLFLCSPRVKRLYDLEQRGLYLSDIPIHDATRGLLMMGQAAESEFENSLRLEELVMELRAVQQSLEDEKCRMSDLLHEMLPISVADRLMAGQTVEAERYESVTILFSDIVGFTSICSKSEPMEIVNMLNRLYSMFDQVVGRNKVYKVETIGDAYMVVGGLPERNTIHAECVANQALDMMHYCRQVPRPDNGEPIVMRIGIHSGEVVAGIVGRKMPRFCLFGNTVNVASRTESNGIPGNIQITEYTHNLLKDNPSFVFEYRGPMEFKNVSKPILCYFLLSNADKGQFTPVVVSDDPSPGYEFIVSRPASPPPSPYVGSCNVFSPTDLSRRLSSHSTDDVSLPRSRFSPGIEVLEATPTTSPGATPPQSKKPSWQHDLPLQCPFRILHSPTPPHQGQSPTPPLQGETPAQLIGVKSPTSPHVSSDSDPEYSFTGENSPIRTTPKFEFSRRPPNLDFANQDMLELSMRASTMSPLKEAICEDSPDTPPVSRQPSSKLVQSVTTTGSDSAHQKQEERVLAPTDTLPVRKSSDASNHSNESARAVSDTNSSGSGDVRKLSTTSNPEGEERKTSSEVPGDLESLQRTRAGSVTKTVKYYDSLSRRRRSGLSTTYATNNLVLNSENGGAQENCTLDTEVQPKLPPNTLPTAGRPKRKSLDSVGSSGSTD